MHPLSLAGENAEVSMDVSLAYRDDMFAEWTEMAHERVHPGNSNVPSPPPKVGYLNVLVDGVFICFQGCGNICSGRFLVPKHA